MAVEIPKVYIVQTPTYLDEETQQYKAKYDFRPARIYGELVYLLKPTAAPFQSASIINELHEKLKDFSEDDFLLLVGNPAIIGWAAAIAAQYSDGKLNLLQWHGRNNGYTCIKSDVYNDSQDILVG